MCLQLSRYLKTAAAAAQLHTHTHLACHGSLLWPTHLFGSFSITIQSPQDRKESKRILLR